MIAKNSPNITLKAKEEAIQYVPTSKGVLVGWARMGRQVERPLLKTASPGTGETLGYLK